MRTIAIAVALGSLVAMSAVGCGRQPGEESNTAAQAQATSVVPAGTDFTVRLASPIGTSVSSAGQFFTAKLATPLKSATGQVLVKEGSIVRGRIAGVEHGAVASLQLDFQSIDTGHGLVPLAATVRKMQGQPGAFSAEEVYSASLGYDAVILPPQATVQPAQQGQGEQPSGVGGGPAPSAECTPSNAVNLPVGTPIDMVLTRPLNVGAAPQS